MIKNSFSLIKISSMILILLSFILQTFNYNCMFLFDIGFVLFLLLLGYKSFDNDFKSVLKQIYIPYILLIVILVIIAVGLNVSISFTSVIKSIFMMQLPDNSITFLYHLWILPYIILSIIFLPLLKRIPKNKIINYLIFISIASSLLVACKNVSYNLIYLSAIMFGYALANIKKDKRLIIGFGIINTILILTTLYIKLSNPFILPTYIMTYQNIIFSWTYIGIAIAMFMFMFIKKSIKFNIPNKIEKFIDSNNYYIFLVSYPLLVGSFSLMNITPYKVLNIFITLLSIILSVFILRNATSLLNKGIDKVKLSNKNIDYKPLFFLIILSIFITLITFYFSSGHLKIRLFINYLLDIRVFILNFTPIFLSMCFIYLLSKRMWFSFLITDLIFIIPSFINRIKLVYRDYPFVANDLVLYNEAMKMSHQYSLTINIWVILVLILLIFITFILIKKVKKSKLKLKYRLIIILPIVIVALFSYKFIYTSEKVYKYIGDVQLVNKYSEAQQFEVRGFVYSFLYSTKINVVKPPADYDEKETIKILDTYKDSKIPDDKKVNVIGIMYEAFNDFSRYDIDFNVDLYEKFRDIYNNSYHGYLIVNPFGGGTRDTENAFLTNNYAHASYLTKTNSNVWYFKNNGYNTNAFHPGYGWFYNRRSVYEGFGFDNFYYYENHFQKFGENSNLDKNLNKTIIEKFDENTKGNDYSFQFSVTYQNHGPYSEAANTDIEYLKKKKNGSDETYNIVNNYFSGIKDTIDQMDKLLQHFEKEEKPVIIVMFGDHNPFLGDGDKGYQYIGLDVSASSAESFNNKYSIPYIFWANSSAKEKLNKDFKQEGNIISPNYLMSELFSYIGYEGSQYTKYLTDLKKDLNVITSTGYYQEDGKFADELAGENKNKFDEYNNVQYYLQNNFNEKRG